MSKREMKLTAMKIFEDISETRRHFEVSSKSKILKLFKAEKGKTHIILRKLKKWTPNELLIDQEEIFQKLYENNLTLSGEYKAFRKSLKKTKKFNNLFAVQYRTITIIALLHKIKEKIVIVLSVKVD